MRCSSAQLERHAQMHLAAVRSDYGAEGYAPRCPNLRGPLEGGSSSPCRRLVRAPERVGGETAVG
jgi:hypothetical protein